MLLWVNRELCFGWKWVGHLSWGNLALYATEQEESEGSGSLLLQPYSIGQSKSCDVTESMPLHLGGK